jgi:hypothetical protein
LFIQTAWRNRVNKYRQAREDLIRWLPECIFKGFIELHRKADGHEDDFVSQLQEVLDTTAYALKLNPIENMIGRYIPGKRFHYGSISVWYLEPDSDQPTALKILRYSSPEVPHEIREVFDDIKENFRPVILDENWYVQTKNHLTIQNVFRRDLFRELPDRTEHVSIAGYVYIRGYTIPTASTANSILFDPSVLKRVEDNVPHTCLPWLKWQTFAAFPVFSPVDEGNTARGVLIAFKNSPQPFMGEDRAVLAAASRLLGILCTRASQIEQGEESGIKSATTEVDKKGTAVVTELIQRLHAGNFNIHRYIADRGDYVGTMGFIWNFFFLYFPKLRPKYNADMLDDEEN